MKLTLIILLLAVTSCRYSKMYPEEVALKFFIDSLVNKPIFDDLDSLDRVFLIPNEIYENGFLKGYKLYTDGFAYKYPETSPMNPSFDDPREFGFSEIETKRFERILKASWKYDKYPIQYDSIAINIPKSIEKISNTDVPKNINSHNALFIQVRRAVKTDQESHVQLFFWDRYNDEFYSNHFTFDFILDNHNNIVYYDIGGWTF